MAKSKGKAKATFSCATVDINLDEKTYDRNLEDMLYNVHYNMSSKELAKEAAIYAKKLSKYKKVAFSNLPDWSYNVLGKYCCIVNHGGTLKEETEKRLHTMIGDAAAKAQEVAATKKAQEEAKQSPTGRVLSIQDRLRMKTENVCGEEFEGLVDKLAKNPKTFDMKKFDPVGIFHTHELKQGHLRYIAKFYEPLIQELNEYLANEEDEDLKEGYKHLGKTGTTKLIKLYQSIIDASAMVITKAKATRKPSKKKPLPAEKIIAKLKYLNDDKALKLSSINPIEILGAKQLWVYNTKYRKIIVYNEYDDTGLYVKGASITSFAETSKQKTLRKPLEQVREFKGPKASFNRVFKELTSVSTNPTGRLNEYCILLKVFK